MIDVSASKRDPNTSIEVEVDGQQGARGNGAAGCMGEIKHLEQTQRQLRDDVEKEFEGTIEVMRGKVSNAM